MFMSREPDVIEASTFSCDLRPVAGPVEPAGSTGRGRGKASTTREGPAPRGGQEAKRERVSNPSDGLPGFEAMDLGCALRHTDMPDRKVLCGSALWAPVRRRAHPLSFLRCNKAVQVKRLLAQQHVVDGSSELGCQDAQGFALPVLLLDPREVLASRCIPTQEQARGFGEGPLEVDIADLAPGGLLCLSRRLMSPLDQAGVRQKVLDAGKPLEIIDLVEQCQSQNLADSWEGAQDRELMPMVLADLVEQEELELADYFVVGADQGNVGRHGHLDAALVEVLDDGSPVAGLVDPLFEDGEVVLGVGVLDVREQLCAFPDREGAAPHEIPGGPLIPRIDIAYGRLPPRSRAAIL